MQISQIKVLLFSVATVFSVRAARAEDVRAVYSPSDLIPGATVDQRWKFISANLPLVLGQTREQIQSKFGTHPNNWSSRCVNPETLEYCISQEVQPDGTCICQIEEFEFSDGMASSICVSDTRARKVVPER